MQLQICNSGEIWTSVSAVEAHRIVRKRTGALAKMIRDARSADKQAAREYRRAERELQQELRDADRRSRVLWKRIRVKPDDRPRSTIERKPQTHRPTRSGWLAAASQLPRYSGPIVDRMRRTGIFFRVRYYGHATTAGVGRRATLYIWQGAYEADDGRVMFMSNVGESIEEAVAALEAVELFNREAQAGAKVLFHSIANVPWQLVDVDGGTERMFEIGRRFAEQQFGSRDLPFALALHPPSDEGDRRNWHLHLLFSTRPLVRTADHQWDIGRMMRREIDNPEAFEEMRHLYARIQTGVMREAGFDITYTALSNAERGLPNAPQKHLGAGRTARVRRGERDEVNERNWEAMLAGEAALLDERLRHEQEQAASERALLERVEARVAPIVADLAAGTPVSISVLDSKAEPVINLAGVSATLLTGTSAPVLPLANLQPGDRRVADFAALQAILPFSVSDTPAIPPVRSAVLGRSGSIQVPNAAWVIDGNPSGYRVTPTLPGIRRRHRHLARMARLAGPSVSPAPPLLTVTSRSAPVDRAITKLPPWVTIPSITNDAGLSIGLANRPAQRAIDVPKQSGLTDVAVDLDIDAVFRLLDARRAELAVRERARRNQMAAESAAAERARQALEDQREREREEAERRQLEAEQAIALQAEQDTSAALDAMLAAIEAERILVTFADDRCVVDDAVIERFGVASPAVLSTDAQTRLDAIADRQRAEIEPIVTHVVANGGHIVHRDRGWTLSADAPEHMRRIADAWIHEPLLQSAFAQAAAVFSTMQAAAEPVPQAKPITTTAPRPSRHEMLILAARQRGDLTERWQRTRRYDDVHAVRGSETDAVEQGSASVTAPRRQLPFEPGHGR